MDVVPASSLARDRVRYAGEPIAGGRRDGARGGGRAGDHGCLREAPAVVDQEAAIKEGAPRLHETVPSNIAFRFHRAGGDAARAFTQADVVIRRRFANNRVTAAPLEGRAVLSDFNAGSGRLTHHTSSQLPLAHADPWASALRCRFTSCGLSLPTSVADLGPSSVFMLRTSFARSCRCAPAACAWAEGRSESFLATTHGRDQIQYAELAARRDGQIIGLRTRLIADLETCFGHGAGVPAINTGLSVTGPYRIANVETEVIGVYTNRTPTGPYRGAGHPEASFLIERMVDDLAGSTLTPRKCVGGILSRPLLCCYRLPTGLTLDSGIMPLT